MKTLFTLGVAAAAIAAIPAGAQDVGAEAPPQIGPAARQPTRANAEAQVERMFGRVDKDGDGFVTEAEAQAFQDARQARRAQLAQEAAPDASKQVVTQAIRQRGRGGLGGLRLGANLMRADTDKDGKVSLAEAKADTLQRFDAMDSNRDGQISIDEARARAEQGRAIPAAKGKGS